VLNEWKGLPLLEAVEPHGIESAKIEVLSINLSERGD
jgi:hypothetical protein